MAPQRTIPVSVEGTVTYKALLFIPGKTPYDFYTKDYKKGLQLYSGGVLIMENCADLLPITCVLSRAWWIRRMCR